MPGHGIHISKRTLFDLKYCKTNIEDMLIGLEEDKQSLAVHYNVEVDKLLAKKNLLLEELGDLDKDIAKKENMIYLLQIGCEGEAITGTFCTTLEEETLARSISWMAERLEFQFTTDGAHELSVGDVEEKTSYFKKHMGDPKRHEELSELFFSVQGYYFIVHEEKIETPSSDTSKLLDKAKECIEELRHALYDVISEEVVDHYEAGSDSVHISVCSLDDIEEKYGLTKSYTEDDMKEFHEDYSERHPYLVKLKSDLPMTSNNILLVNKLTEYEGNVLIYNDVPALFEFDKSYKVVEYSFDQPIVDYKMKLECKDGNVREVYSRNFSTPIR